jgi:hypothetical protein
MMFVNQFRNKVKIKEFFTLKQDLDQASKSLQQKKEPER